MNLAAQANELMVKLAKEQAARHADPNCKKCHGTGNNGYWVSDGKRQLIVCKCAEHSFMLSPEDHAEQRRLSQNVWDALARR